MEFYGGKFTKNEPRSFWTFTIVAVLVLSLLVLFSLWFFGWGHDTLDPTEDGNPNAAILVSSGERV